MLMTIIFLSFSIISPRFTTYVCLAIRSTVDCISSPLFLNSTDLPTVNRRTLSHLAFLTFFVSGLLFFFLRRLYKQLSHLWGLCTTSAKSCLVSSRVTTHSRLVSYFRLFYLSLILAYLHSFRAHIIE